MCSREEFFTYLKSVFSIEPTPANNQDVIRQLCEDVRARVPGAESRLLSTAAVGLASIGASFNLSPGELVSALWDAVQNEACDLVQFRGDIRTQIRNMLRSEASRKAREAEFFSLYMSEERGIEEGFPDWLWTLELTWRELRIWIGNSILKESDREIGEAIGESPRSTKHLRHELYKRLEKKLRQLFR